VKTHLVIPNFEAICNLNMGNFAMGEGKDLRVKKPSNCSVE
jgi:hypothetical protein